MVSFNTFATLLLAGACSAAALSIKREPHPTEIREPTSEQTLVPGQTFFFEYSEGDQGPYGKIIEVVLNSHDTNSNTTLADLKGGSVLTNATLTLPADTAFGTYKLLVLENGKDGGDLEYQAQQVVYVNSS